MHFPPSCIHVAQSLRDRDFPLDPSRSEFAIPNIPPSWCPALLRSTTTAGVSDWDATERSQIRQRLGIDGTTVTIAPFGQLQFVRDIQRPA